MIEENLYQSLKSEASLRLKDESLARILQCIDSLDDDQLWYSPNSVTNSVGNLVLHLSGNIRQYLCHGIGGEVDIRVRDKEFSPQQNTTRDSLKSLITDAILDGLVHVNGIAKEDWLKNINVQVFTLSQYSALIHVIEHTSYHVGQITLLTKSLTGLETGYYSDLDL